MYHAAVGKLELVPLLVLLREFVLLPFWLRLYRLLNQGLRLPPVLVNENFFIRFDIFFVQTLTSFNGIVFSAELTMNCNVIIATINEKREYIVAKI